MLPEASQEDCCLKMTTSASVDSNHFGNTPFESLLSNDKNTSVNMKALFKTQTAFSSKRLKE